MGIFGIEIALQKTIKVEIARIYDIQKYSLDVLHSYVDNNSALLARSSSGFYAGLLDTMSSWVSTQTNIDKDHINEVLLTTKNHINSKTQSQMGGIISTTNKYEDQFSDDYKTLNSQLQSIQQRTYNSSSDEDVLNLMGHAHQQLSITEYNHFVAKTQPNLTVHNMFESGQWDDIRDKYSAAVGLDLGREQLYSCLVAAIAAATGPVMAPRERQLRLS